MSILYVAVGCTVVLVITEACKAIKHKFDETKRYYEERKAFHAARAAYCRRCHYRI